MFFAVILSAVISAAAGHAAEDLAKKFNEVLSQAQPQNGWQIKAADVYTMITEKSRIFSLSMSGRFLSDNICLMSSIDCLRPYHLLLSLVVSPNGFSQISKKYLTMCIKWYRMYPEIFGNALQIVMRCIES
jgi:hypothetical protein